MKYYCYMPDAVNFASVVFDARGTEALVDRVYYSDRPVAKKWKPLTGEWVEDDADQRGDFPCVTNYFKLPLLTERAWRVLEGVIGYCTESLPVTCGDDKLNLLHVMEAVDCLDRSRARVTLNSATGRVSKIMKYAFHKEVLGGKHIFKLPLDSGAGLFVDESFRTIVEQNGLMGLTFEELQMADD